MDLHCSYSNLPVFGKLSIAAWWLAIALPLSGSFSLTCFTAVFQLVLTVRECVKVDVLMKLLSAVQEL